jgi:predicted nucleic acid-binding protein
VSDQILVDTGPLVALIDSDSHYHDWAVNIWKRAKAPAYTCEAVITEATFLLQRDAVQTDALYELICSGSLAIGLHFSDCATDIRALIKRYKNIPISFADACLVRLSELKPNHRVVTFDSDFNVYRKHGNKVIPLLSPNPRA